MALKRTAVKLVICFEYVAVLSPSSFLKAQECETWVQRDAIPAPSPRGAHGMDYDSARNVTVLFGGTDDSTEFQDTWEWDGFTWLCRGSGGPSPRFFPGMTYDSARHVTVLFGGYYDSLAQTWEWDGATWTLRAATGPSARYAHAMAFDRRREVTVLFGGWLLSRGIHCFPCTVNDTWEWNGSVWRRVSTTGPSPRYLHAMAFDEARGVTVLVGGYDGGHPGDVWEWDGQVWQQRAGDGPTPRRMHTLAYDSDRGMVVMFGGVGADDVKLNDTWGWDGTQWTPINNDGPLPRCHHAMVYDAARAALLLFGGTSDDGRMDDTWQFAECIDRDEDGILDYVDACLASDLRQTIMISDCETDVANHLLGDGCSMSDRIQECADAAANHGDYVSCVAKWTRAWQVDGLMNRRDRSVILRCAAHFAVPPRGSMATPVKPHSPPWRSPGKERTP